MRGHPRYPGRLDPTPRTAPEEATLEGEVVWASDGSGGRPQGYGVRFGKLPAEVLERLVAVVTELEREAGA